MSKRVLITDGFWRKTLATVRSLGRRGYKLTVGETSYLNPSFFSRYIEKRFIYPSPLTYPEKFIESILKILRTFPHDIIIPMESDTIALLLKEKKRIERHTTFPFVDIERFLLASSKIKMTHLAKELGIPVPRSFSIRSTEEIGMIESHLKFPLLLKPDIGEGGSGQRVCYNKQELKEAISLHLRKSMPCLIQEYLSPEGFGIGVSLLYDLQGNLKASFVHKRIREFPPEGGPSTLRESVWRPDLVKKAHRLMSKIGWVGLAMIEFRYDPKEKKEKFLEVNPRPWGSIALAIDSGVDFPYLLCKVALRKDFPEVHNYKIGHKTRWLLPGDLLHFLSGSKMRAPFKEFFPLRAKNLSYDIISINDPGPTIGKLLSFFACFYDPKLKSVLQRRKNVY